MVCVCSGCDFYHPLTAAMLGSIAGMLYLFTSALMVKLRYWHRPLQTYNLNHNNTKDH